MTIRLLKAFWGSDDLSGLHQGQHFLMRDRVRNDVKTPARICDRAFLLSEAKVRCMRDQARRKKRGFSHEWA